MNETVLCIYGKIIDGFWWIDNKGVPKNALYITLDGGEYSY